MVQQYHEVFPGEGGFVRSDEVPLPPAEAVFRTEMGPHFGNGASARAIWGASRGKEGFVTGNRPVSPREWSLVPLDLGSFPKK